MNCFTDYAEKSAASERARMLPFATLARFTFGLVDIHPTTRPGRDGVVFKPRHSLSIPPLPRLELDEVFYDRGERLLYDRTDILDKMSTENAELMRLMREEPVKGYAWLVGLELGLSGTGFHFSQVDWVGKTFSVQHLRWRLLRPTAAEIAQWAERRAA